ncbi:esterase-like activity of phytase family protein [Ruixingdingia sedimenti]|uniref:Esterase-like activity of phytase family protein n=1 Tax=Ruixingdingia sedimenti TaxID=3073604 RepID=A0ABU1F7A2_9RHOB|nr:esterase-like activity of phytase family protein [Xinfangfangia sp. LG-4]MDR5652755.1 esterase-like activity of phytase family protein [Xinfangfangia sp. LG-4]
MRRRTFLALAGAAAVLPAAEASAAGPARIAGVTRWRDGAEGFGGISGLWLGPGGAALALGDRGVLFTAEVTRDATGRIAALRTTGAHPLRGPSGAVLPELQRDAEGLAVAPDGRIFVSFEGRGGGRILSYAHPGAPARRVPGPPEFAGLSGNAGLESLAIDPHGRLHALPEKDGPEGFRLWAQTDTDTGWTVRTRIPPSGGFRAVATDFGPDGRFYLLERRFSLPLRFASRLRRFTLPDPEGEVLWQSPPGRFDNLEGLAITRDGAGRLRAAMVSDDNLMPFQRTEVVECLLPG